jgi:hypothetical protein
MIDTPAIDLVTYLTYGQQFNALTADASSNACHHAVFRQFIVKGSVVKVVRQKPDKQQ